MAGRGFAVVWMFFWLAAQAACVHHCGSQVFATGGVSACCAKRVEASSRAAAPGAPVTPTGSQVGCCDQSKALKSETARTPEPPGGRDWWPVENPHLGIEIGIGWRSTVEETAPPDAARPRSRRTWVFEPEVSLGAALHSQAPPVAAMA